MHSLLCGASSAFRSESLRAAGGVEASAPSDSSLAAVRPVAKKSGRVVSLATAEMFAHLQQYKKVSVSTLLTHKDAQSIHPAVLQLGLRYADGSISGANARCVAMMHTLCQFIADYTTPDGKSLSRDLTQQLNTIINFLVECRPLSVSMGNAIKFIKLKLSKVGFKRSCFLINLNFPYGPSLTFFLWPLLGPLSHI